MSEAGASRAPAASGGTAAPAGMNQISTRRYCALASDSDTELPARSLMVVEAPQKEGRVCELWSVPAIFTLTRFRSRLGQMPVPALNTAAEFNTRIRSSVLPASP